MHKALGWPLEIPLDYVGDPSKLDSEQIRLARKVRYVPQNVRLIVIDECALSGSMGLSHDAPVSVRFHESQFPLPIQKNILHSEVPQVAGQPHNTSDNMDGVLLLC